MVWFKQQYLWIIISAAAVCVSSQELNSTLRNGSHACRGEEVIFTCTIRGTNLILAWSSTEYIGQGNPLRFTTQDTPGRSRTSEINGNVTATLTNITNINGVRTLVSELRIVADQASTVTCTSETTSNPISQVFYVSVIPGAPQNVRAAQVSERIDDNCIILVTWDPPTNIDVSDIDHYIVTIPSQNITENGPSAIIAFRERNCSDDDAIQVAAVNRFGCVGENSLQTRPSLLDSIARITGSTTSTPVGSTTSTPIGSTSASASIIAAASIAAVLFIILCFIVVLGLILFRILYKRGKKVQDAEQVRMLSPDVSKLEEHVEAEIKLIVPRLSMDLRNRVLNTSVKRDLEELYNALKLKLPSRNIQAAARDLRATLILGRESSKFNETVKEVIISYLEKVQLESGEGIQRAIENMDYMVTGMGIDEEFKKSVRLLHKTKLGTDEYKKVVDELIEKVEEVQPAGTITSNLLSLCEKIKFRNIRQLVKDYHCKQSKHDISDLGTEKDRVSVPIWVDKLDGGWKDSLREAVKAINEAAPGLSLSITEDEKQAIIHVLAIDKKEPYTEVEGNIHMRLSTENFVTKIRLGKWKDDGKKGVCIHELLHALGFHHEHQDAIADSKYEYRLTSGKQITIYKNDLNFIRWESWNITLYPCKKKCRGHSEDHVCKWVLKAYPTKANTDLDEHDMVCLNLVYPPCVDKTASNAGYKPNLGKNGMYYCGREVMFGRTYPGEEYTHFCGPDKGPNCSACRTIKCPRVKEILKGGKWQGMTGRVYCGRPFTEPGILSEKHDGMCGIDNGPACTECYEILNKEHA